MSLNDIIDIALFTAIIYPLLAGLLSERTRLVAGGLFVLGAAYLVAWALNLRLTIFLFNAVFTVFIVMLVIVFQEELRGALERVSLSFLKWRTARSNSERVDSAVEILARVSGELAAQRVGALIVVTGHDQLARRLTGGTELDGHLSEALLKSIFDPHSAGHDGAVIVHNGRLTRFACHLPLSTDVEQLDDRGTRHAAALGLAELTDALCIVVSEERGTMSIAHRGRLRRVSGDQLIQALSEHVLPGGSNNDSGARWWHFFTRKIGLKVVALMISLVSWFAFVHEAVIDYRTFQVPLTSVGLDSGLTLSRLDAHSVKVVLSGPRRSFYFVDASRVDATLYLFDYEPGTYEITLTASDITLPEGLTIVNIFPRTVQFDLERETQ